MIFTKSEPLNLIVCEYTYRVSRNPLTMTSEIVDPLMLLRESLDLIRANKMNLPAAVFAQAIHMESDVFTKMGLPVPVLGTFNEELAGNIYKEHYDFLCSVRDLKMAGISSVISHMINWIIIQLHGLFYDASEGISRELYEVRTRKILLISNTMSFDKQHNIVGYHEEAWKP